MKGDFIIKFVAMIFISLPTLYLTSLVIQYEDVTIAEYILVVIASSILYLCGFEMYQIGEELK